MPKYSYLKNIAFTVGLLTLVSCGGGSSSSEPSQDKKESPITIDTPSDSDTLPLMSVVATKRSLSSGSECPNGGTAIDTGIDINANGILDEDEVTDAETICHGTNGITALIDTSILTDNVTCKLGGVEINTGLDINGNAALEPEEIKKSSTICNHADGAIDGLNALVDLTDEPSSGNCAYGGQKISTGYDLNSDSLLGDDEVLQIKYICNGADGLDGTNGSDGTDGLDGTNGSNGTDGLDGTNGSDGTDGLDGTSGSDGADGLSALASLIDVTPGVNCINGGVRLDAGLDDNSDGVLQLSEINSQNYICNGEDGSEAINSLIDIATEPSGETCASGGQKVTSGQDINVNDTLDEAEINRTAYICNSATEDNSSIAPTEYISYSFPENINLTNYPQCASALTTLGSRTEYYDLSTGTSEEPYSVCTSTYCAIPIENGSAYVNAATGDSCNNFHRENYSCSAGYSFNEELTACIAVEVAPPECSLDNLNLCVTVETCSSANGLWWDGQCNNYCPVGEIETSRGCELIVSESSCTNLQIIEDNSCSDIAFTEINGDICGDYVGPTLVTSGDHLLTCETTFKGLVVFDASTNVNVDSYWSISADNIRIKGTPGNSVTIKASTGNPYGLWGSFNVTGDTAYSLYDGYISGNIIENLILQDNSHTDLENVTVIDSTIDTTDFDLESSYMTDSIITTPSPSSSRSFVVNNTITSAGYFSISGLVALNSINTDENITATNSWSYNTLPNTLLNTSILKNVINSANDTGCYNTSFPYYEKNYIAGNVFTNDNPPPGSVNACIATDNSSLVISTKPAAYILGEETFTLSPGQSITPETIAFDDIGVMQDPTIVWKVRYDEDGVTSVLPETWQGYKPTVTFTEKESYELYIESINGDTDIIGHTTIRVHVQ